jgi:uncharacterized protein (DUF488 family)
VRLFTIGYEGATPEGFIESLNAAGVALVADVRAVALSRKRGFSKTALSTSLAEAGIGYRHWIALGTPVEGRQAARAGDAVRMRLIYEGALAEPAALDAFEELAQAAGERPVCLLCFERDPAFCHRRILAERLAPRGFEAVDLGAL